jgi:hypothetical protein
MIRLPPVDKLIAMGWGDISQPVILEVMERHGGELPLYSPKLLPRKKRRVRNGVRKQDLLDRHAEMMRRRNAAIIQKRERMQAARRRAG